jgi:stage II sporulation protein D
MQRIFSALICSGLSLWAGDLRIGVFSATPSPRLLAKPCKGMSFKLTAGDIKRTLAPDEAITFVVRDNMVEYSLANGRDVRRALSVQLQGSPEFFLSVPGKIERRFRGNLEIVVEAGLLRPVVTTSLETAVASAVLAESSPKTPLESLKALAVASRSYYHALVRLHKNFDFCDSTHCQYFKTSPGPEQASAKATKATEGLILTWNGKPVASRFFAACGGKTKALREIGQAARPYPFYGVECAQCRKQERSWQSRLGIAEAAALLKAPGSDIARMEIIRRHGFMTLPSNNYIATREGDEVVFKGKGLGHGIGLCQAGASGMAAAGALFRDILTHYFPGTALSALTLDPPLLSNR